MVVGKGGWLTLIRLTAKLADPIANRAWAETELIGDFEYRPVVDEDRPHGFVAAMPNVLRLKKELLVGVPIHRAPPYKMSFLFSAETVSSMAFSTARFHAQ
jgi:hypothetical protein